jgi:hypothetical protein
VRSPIEQRIEELLSTMSAQSAEERTHFVERIAAEDPILAAHLSLRVTNSAADTQLLETVPLIINVGLPERFRVSRCLGRGGFGTVYQVYDRERGHDVAVKILRDPHADTLFRFKQEFRSLATLRHPHLIEFYDLFEYHQLWFFTMELVCGPTFLRHVRDGNRCDLRRLRRALRDLADALAWLHAYKLVHRDIKPDNVLIDGSGRLVLLDFGLAARLSGSALSETVSVGTPAYMAPEQTSNLAAIDGAADWYAVGVMLYESLTGRLPFTGTMAEVLLAKVSADPTPPTSISPEVPAAWSQLCLQLLAREPGSRPGAQEVLRWLGEEAAARPQPAGDFFGREAVLSRMLQACESARAGSAQVVELDGPAGYGKSTIVAAFADTVSRRYPDALVLRGRCYEHESLPFKALDAMMDDLSRQLRHMGSVLEPLLPPEIAALARLFPVLERVECIARAIERDPVRIANLTALRRRAFHAFGSLLEAISSQRLVVICLDDLHWGDTDSASLFTQLFSARSIPSFVLVAAFRTEQSTTEFRRHWSETVAAATGRIRHTRLTIGCLDPEAAVEVARSLLARHGVTNEELASALAAQSAGNPLFLEQLAADLVRGHHAGEALRPLTLTELIHDRIRRLSSATREFLQFLAAFGEPLPEDLLARLVHVEGDSAAVVSSMVAQNLVRRRVKSGVHQVEIQNYQICEAILKNVPETERQAVHIRLAEALISLADADAGMIALQFARGGDTARAAEHAEKAAVGAESVLAFNRAAQFYAIALSLGEFDRPRTGHLCERMANAHAAAGRGAEAAADFLRAAESAGSHEAKLALRRQAAEQWIRSGNVREGVSVLTSLGAEYDIRHTDSLLRALISIQWSRVLLRVRGLDYQEHRSEDVAPRDLARLDVYWALTEGLSLWNPVIGTRYQMKYLRNAFEVGEPRRAALGLAMEAFYVALAGESVYPRARSILGRALAVGTRFNDPRIVGTTYAMDAMCGWLTGRWDLARDRGEEAQRILLENCGGVPWALGVARNAWLGGLLWAGRMNEYAALLDEFIQDAQDRGDLNSLAIYLMNRCPVNLAQDNVAQADRDLLEVGRILAGAWTGRGFHIPHFFGLLGRAQLAIYSGDTTSALDLLTRKLPDVRRSYLLRIEVIAVLSLLLEGTLAIACAADRSRPPKYSSDLLRRARRCAKDIRRKPAIWGSGLAMLIEAGAESVEGRMDEASARWSDAERELTRAGMLLYAAAARYCRGRLTGDPELVTAAEEVFRDQGILCIPRFATMLAPGVPCV